MKRNKSVKDMIKKAFLKSFSCLTQQSTTPKSFSCLTRESIIGRSMIEMLGVLAIIGMLSIGGLYALRIAFTRYNTNNLIEDVKLAGFVIVDELFDQLPDDDEGMNMAGKFEQKTAYTFKAFAEEDTTFEIMVQGVPYNVCQELKKRKVDWLEEIRANGIPNTCNENEDNQISFFFNTELGEYPELEENTCRADRDCPLAAPHCRNGYCTKCDEGFYMLTDGSCVSCSSSSGVTTEKDCHTCGENYFLTGTKNCSICTSWTYNPPRASKEECDRCSNRCWNSGKCLNSITGNAFVNQDGTCNYSCQEGEIYIENPYGQYYCATCPSVTGNTSGSLRTTADSCHACGNDYYFGNMSERMCFGCQALNTELSISADQTECVRCPNRYYDGKCRLCPAGKTAAPDGLSCI